METRTDTTQEPARCQQPIVRHVWIFDSNRRIYPPAPNGKLWASGGPIYREHWVKHEVAGETRASYITKHGGKVPKKGGHGFALSEAEVEDDVWRHDHRWRIAKIVGDLRDVSILRKVADVVGYLPNVEPSYRDGEKE